MISPNSAKFIWRNFAVAAFSTLLLVGCASAYFNPENVTTHETINGEVDFAEVHAYALRADATYSTPEKIREKYPNTIRVSTPGDSDTQYFLERDDAAKVQTISVRGTANWTDVVYDAKAHVEEHTGVEIPLHKGFRELSLLLYLDMKPHLRHDYKTRLAGHSLGAAIAAIIMLYLERDGYDVEQTINFGQPKFTTTAGLEHYKGLPLKRVVDKNDIVPMLPPSGFSLSKHGSYVHIGREVILLDGAEYIHLTTHESSRLSVGDYWRTRTFATLADHHVAHYIRRIVAKLKTARTIKYVDWLKKRNLD